MPDGQGGGAALLSAPSVQGSAGDGLLSADNKLTEDAPASAKQEVPGQQRKSAQERQSIVLGNPQQIAAELMKHLTLEQLTQVTELLTADR
ncbi:hypothetical protein ACFYZI_41055 [Streptomyces griseorubiginosus]|uniref:hypothetical protein n=1 Tax=Streptomyces griseorubiginosus TaxID=67304 RepID=UPI0036A36CF8